MKVKQINQVEWKDVEFLECLECEASKNKFKIPKGEFLEKGKYPIIDQGEMFIAGYTNDKTKVYGEKLPVVIFGDHTRALKFVDFPFALGADGIKVLVLKEEISPKYFYYALKKLNIPSVGYSRHYKFLKETIIPIPFLNGKPDLETQEKIVAILEKAEQLKKKRKNALELLDEYIGSVFNEMFVGKGFEEISLGDKKICKISGEYGSGASAINFDGNVRYIRITDIDESGVLRQKKVSPSIIEEKYFLQREDLLFARSGATVGKTYLFRGTEGKSQYAGYLIRFRFNKNILPEFIYSFTKTSKYLTWISSIQRVVAQPNINAKQYCALEIPLPPPHPPTKICLNCQTC